MRSEFLKRLVRLMAEYKPCIHSIRVIISFKEDKQTHIVILNGKMITGYDVHEALDNNKAT